MLRRVLRMAYQGRDREEETTRDVEPLGVVFYGGAWYLVAWCRLRVDYRHFRIDRIKRLELSPEKFEPREDFSFKEHMEQSSAREQTLPVRVWFHRTAQERARRESFATLIEEKSHDGGAEFSLYAWSLEWMARWLLSFGDKAEAIQPPKLRALVRAEAEKIAARHG